MEKKGCKNGKHDFGEIKYDLKITKGYYFPGDPEGTMGIDRRLPGYIGGTEEKRWSRTCKDCGYVQYTTDVSKTVIETPKF